MKICTIPLILIEISEVDLDIKIKFSFLFMIRVSRSFVISSYKNLGSVSVWIGLKKCFADLNAEQTSVPYKSFDMRMDFWVIDFFAHITIVSFKPQVDVTYDLVFGFKNMFLF